MGDSGIDTNNLTKKLDQHVARILEREGYINSEVETKKIPTDGGSYMGTLYEIDIKGKTKHGYKETHLFAKHILEVQAMIFSVQDVYKRELFAYSELSNIFNELQDEVNVPVSERYKMAGFFEESDEEIIILENLSKDGFKTYFRTDLLNIDFAKLAVKQLATFHGLAFVLKSKRPFSFKEYIESIEVPYKFDQFWNDFVDKMIIFSLNFLEDDLKDKYEKVIIEKVKEYPKYMKENCKVRTLCHGDYRHNNILVKEVVSSPIKKPNFDF